jgi:tetratricopeptide (TPR) repeat protein
LREYAKEKSGQVYSSAAFEMGQLNMDRRDWKTAADYFSKVEKQNKHYAEAAFYAGMSFYKMGNLGRALGELLPLSSELPLTTVYNNAGAVSIQSSLGAKDTDERARLVSQGLKLLERASASSPEDPIVRFNYAMALFLAARYKDSAEQLIPVITADPRDGQAHFLRAKALERSNAPEAQAADNEARKYLQSYARLQTQWQKNQAISDIPVRLYQSFNRRPYFDKLRSDVASTKGNARAGVQSQDLLLKAKQLYNEGRDDEALPELRRVLIAEPMSAEAYLLIGRINQRQGNLDAAISALKTAIFWDAKMIDAHILLGRIFLEKGDRAMAATYASSAIQLDQANQEAVALQRQVTMGKN